MVSIMKIGRMPTAEIVEWPRRPLESRKRKAVLDAIITEENDIGKYELIERTLGSLRLGWVEFAELVLLVMEENYGLRSKKWHRVDERKRA